MQVKAAGINPGEAKIREGLLDAMWPATFPSGEGSDLAGRGRDRPGRDRLAAGDEVIGFTDNRASQAEYVVVEAQNLTAKPAGLPWEVAGALFVAGATAYAAVRAVALTEGDTVVVSGAAGGVGSIAVQLARLAGATVIGLASEAQPRLADRARRHPCDLRRRGSRPDPAGRRGRWTRSSTPFGGGYVELALELGVGRPGSTRSPGSTRCRSTASRPRATRPGPARAPGRAGRADRDGRARGPDRRDVPAERGPGCLPRLASGHIRGKIVLIRNGTARRRARSVVL